MKKVIIILALLIALGGTAYGQCAQQVGVMAEGQLLPGSDHNDTFGSGSLSAVYRLQWLRLSVNPYAGVEYSGLDLAYEWDGYGLRHEPFTGGPRNAWSLKLGFDVAYNVYDKLEVFTGLGGNAILACRGDFPDGLDNPKGWCSWRAGLGLKFSWIAVNAGYELRISGPDAGHYTWKHAGPFKLFAGVKYYFKTF